MLPEPIQKFIEYFSKLPSLGPRMATRLAFYLTGVDKADLKNLETALHDIQTLSRCPQCFFIKNGGGPLCAICSNPKRDANSIAIVEKETDLLSLEKTGKFHGQYFVLGELTDRGMLETAQKLRIQNLKTRIASRPEGKVKEIIIALPLNSFGDFTTGILKEEFRNLTEKVTRIGRGIPTGGEIEFADEETLNSALERRL